MKTTKEVFIENLRRLRKAKFRRQEDFAPLAGFESVRGYQKYEQGESAPTPDILDRLAVVLGCRSWELLAPADEIASVSSQIRSAVKEALVEIAPRRDELELARLRKENGELREKVNRLPDDFWAAWPPKEPRQRAFALFFATLNRDHLRGVKKEFVAQTLDILRRHKLLPTKITPKGS